MNWIDTGPADEAGERVDEPGGPGSLLFSCRPGEQVVLRGRDVSVRVVAVMSNRVRIAVEAPGGVAVVREGVRDTAAPPSPPRPSPT